MRSRRDWEENKRIVFPRRRGVVTKLQLRY